MELIRKIINSDSVEQNITLPPAFLNKKIEILIFPVDDKLLPTVSRKTDVNERGSAFGELSMFANPSLIDSESIAWVSSVESKYANY